MAKAFANYKGSEPAAERTKVSVKDIVDMPFTIDAIRIKHDMVTKFGNMDTAIVDLTVNDTPAVLFATQKVLFDKFEYLHDQIIDFGGCEFVIERKTSKTGNPFYDVDDFE